MPRRPRRLSTQQLAETTEHRRRAEANYAKAREAVDQMVTRLADEYLIYIPEMKDVRRQLLEDAGKLNSELIKLNPQDPEAYLARARVHGLLGRRDAQLEDLEKATNSLQTIMPTFKLLWHGSLSTATRNAA